MEKIVKIILDWKCAMSYFKFEVDGSIKEDLTNREIDILQNTFLNLAAMTNALIVGKGVMLNPPDEGKLGITFAYRFYFRQLSSK